MIIFLYGLDSYRSKQKLDEIISHYKAVRKSGLNLMLFDASQKDFSDFYDHFKISSMFAETKLAVVKNAFASKKFQEDFLAELESLQSLKDVIVVYEADPPDERLKLFKTLLKQAKCQEFALLTGAQTKTWAAAQIKSQNAKINLDALDLLVSRAGDNLWNLAGEIKKLMHFKGGQTIKKEDVELMVRPRIENDIFKTIDALAAKNKPQALALLRRHLDGGDNALYLLSMIGYQFKNLLVVKELAQKGLMYASIVKKSGLHPFVVKKNYFASSQFSFDELKSIYHKIYRMDSDIKTGKVEPETALDLLVAQL